MNDFTERNPYPSGRGANHTILFTMPHIYPHVWLTNRKKLKQHNRDTYTQMSNLARVVREFEAILFGERLTQGQKDILHACIENSNYNKSETINSESIRRSAFCRNMSQPTYNRALRKLVEGRYLEKASKAGEYKLGHSESIFLNQNRKKLYF